MLLRRYGERVDNPLLYVLGQVLPLAVGISLSPLPVIAVVLVAMSPRARTSGPAFVVGRMLGLAAVLAVVITAADVLYAVAASAGLPSIVKLVLGLAILVLGLTKWRPQPAGTEPALPKWMSALESMPPGRSIGFAFLLTIANPKELALLVGVGLTVGGAPLAVLDEVLLAAVFVVVASLTVLTPVVAVLVAPTRMRPILDGLGIWLTANNKIVMGVLLVVIGAMVAGGAISDLAA